MRAGWILVAAATAGLLVSAAGQPGAQALYACVPVRPTACARGESTGTMLELPQIAQTRFQCVIIQSQYTRPGSTKKISSTNIQNIEPRCLSLTNARDPQSRQYTSSSEAIGISSPPQVGASTSIGGAPNARKGKLVSESGDA